MHLVAAEESVVGDAQQTRQDKTRQAEGVVELVAAEESVVGESQQTRQEKTSQAEGVVELVAAEESVVGAVAIKTYALYFIMGGLVPSLIVAVLFVAAQSCVILADWWLNMWASVAPKEQRKPLYLGVFAALTFVGSALAFGQAAIFFLVSLRAASRLHDSAFAAITRAPLSFFAANPLGRILNKFSSDQGIIDEDMPQMLFQTVQMALIVLGAVVLACIAVPWLIAVLLPVGVSFYFTRRRFLASGREIKRLDSTSKSPIFAAISNGVTGLVTIRTYGIAVAEHERVLRLLEASGRAWFSWLLINRWIGVRLDLITFALLAACVCILIQACSRCCR